MRLEADKAVSDLFFRMEDVMMKFPCALAAMALCLPALAEPDEDLEAVGIYTIHRAKGLEFPMMRICIDCT